MVAKKATQLLLWKAPTNFLPILLGDYLAVHFALYGVLTLIGLRLAGARGFMGPMPRNGLAFAVLAVALYCIVVIGGPIDLFVTSFVPVAVRVPVNEAEV